MAFSVRLSRSAQNDIEETMDFLTKRSPNQAQTWFEGLFEALESLREMPARNALIAEADRLKRPLRALIYKSHRVVYEIDEARQLVSIVRVYHTKRAPL